MYKKSAFNVVNKDVRRILIFNTKTKRYLKSMKDIEEISDLIEYPNKYPDHPLIPFLKDAGVIVNQACDEMQHIGAWRNEYIYSPKLELCILPTEQCNLRCPYCYEDFKHGTMSQETQDALMNWLRKNLRNYTELSVSWFGGEPLLAKDVIASLSQRMLDLCHQARKPFSASITTNGTLLDLDTFAMLQKYRITGIQVTLDGPKETHDKVKGIGSYDKVISNLLAIRDKVKSSHSIYISVRTNVTKDTLSTMDKYLDKLAELFANDCKFGFYFRPVGNWKMDEHFSLSSSLLDSLFELYNPIIEHRAPLNYNAYCNLLENQICAAAKRNQYVIRADGTVCKCTMLLDDERNHIGNLSKSGEMKLDEDRLQEWVNSFKEVEKCGGCSFAPSCMSIMCPAKKFTSPEKPRCGYEPGSITYIMELLDQCDVFEIIPPWR